MAAPPISERHLPHFHRRAPVKELVRVATTANITISTALNSGDTIDGVTLANGDRVLVKDQSTASQNGIYEVSASPARAYDLSTDDPGFGYLVVVIQGTANAGTIWRNTNTSAPTIGSTSITFAQISGVQAGAITTSGLTMATARLLGRTTASTGAIEEITVGSGLSLSAGSLSATGGGTGTVSTASDGTTDITDPDTIEITGTGGIDVSVSESPAGTAAFVVDGSGVSGGSTTDPVISLFGSPATAFDFDTSSLTGLTALGTATAEDADTTIPGHLYLKKAATSSVALTGRHAAIPGAYPWTAITKLTDHTPFYASFIRYGGLYIAESSPGKVEAIHILSNGAVLSSLVAYTNPTTFSATIGTDRNYWPFTTPIYYAIVANSSTSFDFYVSRNGWIWLARQTARNPGFTVANCGVLVDPEQTAFAVAGAYDFLYFYNSALTFPG